MNFIIIFIISLVRLLAQLASTFAVEQLHEQIHFLECFTEKCNIEKSSVTVHVPVNDVFFCY